MTSVAIKKLKICNNLFFLIFVCVAQVMESVSMGSVTPLPHSYATEKLKIAFRYTIAKSPSFILLKGADGSF